MKEKDLKKFLTVRELNLIKRYQPKNLISPYPKDFGAYGSVEPLAKMFRDFDFTPEDKQLAVDTFWRLSSLNQRYVFISMFYSDLERTKFMEIAKK